MIKHLRIENFKSIKLLEIDCKRVNILIGEPNSGKSNFLESLAIFGHLYGRDLHSFVRFERVPELFFEQNINDLNKSVRVGAGELSYEIRPQGISGEFKLIAKEQGKESLNYTLLGDGRSEGIAAGYSSIRPYFFPTQGSPTGARHNEQFLWPPNGDNLLWVLMTRADLREIAADLVEKYGIRLLLRQHEGKIELEKVKEGIAVSWPYWALSDTLQRVIFYYVAIETNRDATLLFEEPESHSFPYYTKFLAEKIALDPSNQYFITTHNPYLLSAISTKIPEDDLGILLTYFENEQTKVKPLTLEQISKDLELDSSIFFNLDELLKA